MNLVSTWRRPRRRRSGDAADADDLLPTVDDSRPIDTQEQEEMVRSFERALERNSRVWRGVFGSFVLCYLGFMVYSVFHQAWYPWELRYHAYFMEEMHPWMVILADFVAVLACLLVIKGLCHDSNSYKQWFWYSSSAGIFLAIFWFYHMLNLARFRWDILWLPLAPLSASGVCLYVDHLLMESSEDIKRLRNSMYYFKVK